MTIERFEARRVSELIAKLSDVMVERGDMPLEFESLQFIEGLVRENEGFPFLSLGSDLW